MAFAAQRLIRGSLTLLCLALLSHACAPAKPAQEVGQTPQARCEQGDTKACEQRCIAGDSPRCAEVARPLLDSTQDADIAHALQLLETGCTTEDVGSCQLLGELAVSSKIKHRDPTDVAQDVRSACFGHHQPSCTKLAYLYLEGKGVEKDEHRANELFWSACTEGDSTACAYYGSALISGEFPGSPQVGLKHVEKSCREHIAKGCSALGYVYDKGELLEADPKRSIEYYQEACRLQPADPDACGTMAVYHLLGRGVEQDAAKARQLFQRACELGQGQACEQAALMTLNGQGGSRSEEDAFAKLRQTCLNGISEACSISLKLTSEGKFSTHPPEELFRLAELGCRGGEQEACSYLGNAEIFGYGTSSKPHVGLSHLILACQRGSSTACVSHASFLSVGFELPENPAAAAISLKKRCADNVEFACYQDSILSHKGSPLEIRAELEEECSAGAHPSACVRLAEFQAVGSHGLKFSPKASFVELSKLCAEGSLDACTAKGDAFAAARGVTHDSGSAKTLWREACAAGWSPACVREITSSSALSNAAKEERLFLYCSQGEFSACRIWLQLSDSAAPYLASSANVKAHLEATICHLTSGKNCGSRHSSTPISETASPSQKNSPNTTESSSEVSEGSNRSTAPNSPAAKPLSQNIQSENQATASLRE